MATFAPPRAPETARSAGDLTDHQLVTAVRAGDDRAFERLYERYRRRIAAYIYGMVNDYARAEDITQDVFMSALRRMRETDRSIAFKPWIYEIAKNACIDQFRRSRRAEEVSYDAEDGLGAADYGRLVTTGPTPDAAVDQKMSLDHLCGAFGGLSETHHEILVMRELEGLSYREIGERLGMSRPSVESTLFRARRRLTEEYSELTSGERCRRIQAIIATASAGTLGTRDQRRMARHVSYCQSCRRQARLAGLDASILAHVPVKARIAAFLPLPAFLRRRWSGGNSGDGIGGATSNHAATLAQWSSSVSDGAAAGWVKAAATAATIAIAGAGAGAAVSGDSGIAKGLSGVNALRKQQTAAHTRAARPAVPAARHPAGTTATKRRHSASSGPSRTTVSVRSVPERTTSSGATTPAAAAAPTTTSAPPVAAPSLPGTGSASTRPASGGTSTATSTPSTSLPSTVNQTVSGVTDTGTKAGNTVTQTVTTVLGGG